MTENESKSGALILVGTPIGNLGDFSPRAKESLESCDFIAAEDTRVTLKLLNHFGIKKPMVSYYRHNMNDRDSDICDRIEAGETCCLVTDAGMPAISDPGEQLVAQCAKRGIPVLCVPGPSAVVTALAMSGLPTGRFCFEGFLSVSGKSRRAHLEQIAGERRTLIFYEAPHKLLNTLTDLYEKLGDRRIALARELTKLHEEIIRTTLSEAVERYSSEPPRGEFVIIIEGAPEPEAEEISLEDAAQMARELMEDGLSASAAAKDIAKKTLLKKSDIYKLIANSDN
ncbi:MAG: 16S rRNA (cytidine(1402)-2'-O)-methyltransferase [Ruminococcaceae bacterium]|nr:16S rRNA (cytidine(1402)-2'-O)-methyltransferase [Oscillospiraceae bacterium]